MDADIVKVRKYITTSQGKRKIALIKLLKILKNSRGY